MSAKGATLSRYKHCDWASCRLVRCRAFGTHFSLHHYPGLTAGPSHCRSFGPRAYALMQKLCGIRRLAGSFAMFQNPAVPARMVKGRRGASDKARGPAGRSPKRRRAKIHRQALIAHSRREFRAFWQLPGYIHSHGSTQDCDHARRRDRQNPSP